MSIIAVNGLTFGYEGGYENIFDNLSVTLDTSWRLGLIGRNGRGKTTLLRLLLGELEYEGSISVSAPCSYFPLSWLQNKETAWESMLHSGINVPEWQIQRELSLLACEIEILYRPLSSLSPGQITKLQLASLFTGEDQFVLIDEPTNHLDLDARRSLGRYLSAKSGFILVSHDRMLLDECADHIMSINRQSIDVMQGNYSIWLGEKEKTELLEQRQNQALTRDIQRLNKAAQRTAQWSEAVEKTRYHHDNSGLKVDRGYVGARSAAMMKRSKVTQARAQRAVQQKSALLKDLEISEQLQLFPLEHHQNRLVELQKVTACYGEVIGCRDVSLEVFRGERVALNGINGCGKTTVLHLIEGQQLEYTGTVRTAASLKLSTVKQDTSQLTGSVSQYIRSLELDETRFNAILRKLGFERSELVMDIQSLSTGQKKKVLLAASLAQQAHLYIWDEPLNYIDIVSREQIEQLILLYRPTMLFVEHDEAFSNKVATRHIEMK